MFSTLEWTKNDLKDLLNHYIEGGAICQKYDLPVNKIAKTKLPKLSNQV